MEPHPPDPAPAPGPVAHPAPAGDPQNSPSKAYYDAYASYASALRGWLVGFGIGAPVLFVSQASFANVLKRTDLVYPIIYIYLVGVSLQIVISFANKYSMWYQYRGEEEAGFKTSGLYRASVWFSRQIWLDLVCDLASIALLAVATVRLLFAYLETAGSR